MGLEAVFGCGVGRGMEVQLGRLLTVGSVLSPELTGRRLSERGRERGSRLFGRGAADEVGLFWWSTVPYSVSVNTCWKDSLLQYIRKVVDDINDSNSSNE